MIWRERERGERERATERERERGGERETETENLLIRNLIWRERERWRERGEMRGKGGCVWGGGGSTTTTRVIERGWGRGGEFREIEEGIGTKRKV